jgi:hypothetical protein
VAANPIAVSPTPLHRGIEFKVVNNTDLAITAWKVSVTGTLLNGNDLGHGIGCDAYGAYVGLYARDRCMIEPHATVRSEIILDQGEEADLPTVKLTTTCAIFADRTWTGDATQVQHLFHWRTSDLRAFCTIARALAAGAASGTGVDSLRVTIEQLNAKGQDDFENVHKGVMRRNLQIAMDGKIRQSPAEFLSHSLKGTQTR